MNKEIADPVSKLSHVSVKRTAQLKKLGIESCEDLLNHFPRKYQDWTELVNIESLEEGETSTFLGQCASVPTAFKKGKLSILKSRFQDATGTVECVWFNQPFYQSKLHPGKIYLIRGKCIKTQYNLQVQSPEFIEQAIEVSSPFEVLPDLLSNTFIRPVYPLTEGLTQNMLRKIISEGLEDFQGRLVETLPHKMRKELNLCSIEYAYQNIHFPQDKESFETARKRLVFEELFYLQLALSFLREKNITVKSFPFVFNKKQEKEYVDLIKRLPYSLTGAQERVLDEIKTDLKQAAMMNRLVQGDVGSGKTIIATLACFMAWQNNYQSVIMAPTTLLAQQHYRVLTRLFEKYPIKISLLTGQQTAKEKKAIYAKLEDGSIDILVGTHAVTVNAIAFKNLALTITDEQHRFGVAQRAVLLNTDKERKPHNMVMSATPIPRSMGLILYGDLDISLVDEKPLGRIIVDTYTARDKDLNRVYALIQKQLQEGGQIYVVCPLKEEGKSSLISVSGYVEELKKVFKNETIGLLNGSMSQKDQNAVMKDFTDQKINILVSTTVIEVGVDNPRANMILIMNADRFGLAQLHQLRGRVGRGNLKSYCILHSQTQNEKTRKRLQVLCHTDNGFEIAEEDLKLRGPGDFFGVRQHGLPDFKIANLYDDQSILVETKKAVKPLLHLSLEDLKDTYPEIHTKIDRTFSNLFGKIGL